MSSIPELPRITFSLATDPDLTYLNSEVEHKRDYSEGRSEEIESKGKYAADRDPAVEDIQPVVLRRNVEEVVVPLNSVQKAILTKVSTNTFESTLSRTWHYTKDHPGTLTNVFVPNLLEVGIIMDLALGGSLVGGLAGPQGIVIGAAVGGIGAYGVVTIAKIHAIKSSPEYLNWCRERQHLLRNEVVQLFLTKDDLLQHLVCPETNTIPEMPVRFKKTELVFEYRAILNWLETHPRQPYTGFDKPFDQEDLIFDFAHVNFVHARLLTLIDACYDENPQTAGFRELHRYLPRNLSHMVFDYLVGDDFGNRIVNHCILLDRRLCANSSSKTIELTGQIYADRASGKLNDQECVDKLANLKIRKCGTKKIVYLDEGFWGSLKDLLGIKRSVKVITDYDHLED